MTGRTNRTGATPAPRTEVPGDLRLRAERAEARVAELEAKLADLQAGIAFDKAMRAAAPIATAVLEGAL